MRVLHGEDQVASRQAFLSQKQQALKTGLQLVELSGSDLNLDQLIQATDTQSLLGATNIAFIEELFSRRPSTEKTKIIDYLKNHPQSPIVVWESKDVSLQLKSFAPNLSQKFDLPKVIFQFLDTFSVNHYQTALKNSSPEQILALLSQRLTHLIQIIDGQTPPELASWQTQKLSVQAKKYDLHQLVNISSELLIIDFHHKTGRLDTDLSTALELWLLKNVN